MDDAVPSPLRPRPRAAAPSLADAAYAALKAAILDGTLPPGHQAAEQEVAERLGMSRTPVHEAALRLQHEGLVAVLARRGVRVLPIGAADLRQIYQVLVALEGAAAELLAEAPDAGVLAALEAATAAMDAALAVGDRRAWAAADDRFHRALLEGCGNARLGRLAATVADQARRARLATSALRPAPGRSAPEHRHVLRAIRAGDPEAARAAVAAHRRRAGAEIVSLLEGQPPSP